MTTKQVFSLAAFLVVVVWIDLIASEIMAVLFTFGVVFQLSDAILGLTILAWGNSVGGNQLLRHLDTRLDSV